MSILSDILNYLHFCADMERLDSLESLGQQIPLQHYQVYNLSAVMPLYHY